MKNAPLRSRPGKAKLDEAAHLTAYVDEQALRFNNREMNDQYRFRFAMRHIVGRQLT